MISKKTAGIVSALLMACVISWANKDNSTTGKFLLKATTASYANKPLLAYEITDGSSVYILSSDDSSSYATGVQFNEFYAVTARHIGFNVGTSIDCMEAGCDLKFIRNDGASQHRWRDPKYLEKITLVGASENKIIKKIYGTVLPSVHHMDGGSTPYNLMIANVTKGMSGGPVYGEDGSILGIIIGYFDKSELKNSDIFADYADAGIGIFIRSSEIEKQYRALGLSQSEKINAR